MGAKNAMGTQRANDMRFRHKSYCYGSIYATSSRRDWGLIGETLCVYTQLKWFYGKRVRILPLSRLQQQNKNYDASGLWNQTNK